MNITLDGKELTGNKEAKNLVEFLDEQGVKITAPCYRSGRAGGCCAACVLEIDGKKAYACATKPKDGMNIVYKRKDLVKERQEKWMAFEKMQKEGTGNSCCSGACKGC